MAWVIGWTFIRALKGLKNCALMGSFCPKHIVYQQENFIGIMGHNISFHISINCLMLYLSLQNACWIFSRTFIFHHPYVGKIVKFMEFTSLENTLIRGKFTTHSKLTPKFLSSHPGQKKITHCPWQHSFENLFLPTAERDGGNYDLLYKNSVTKYEDDLEH